MPSTVKQSSLKARFGKRLADAAAKAAAAPIDWGNERLPGGITNGIARLITAEFGQVAQGKQNAGKDFLRMAGVVVEPEFVEVNGVKSPVKGRQTSIIEMLCDTKSSTGEETSFEEHIFKAANHMKMIGGEGFDTSDIEEAAQTLVSSSEDPVTGQPCGPHFRFSTRESPETRNADGSVKYAARVWETWWGSKGLEGYTPPEEAGVQDGTEPPTAAPSANGQGKGSNAKTPRHTSRVAQAAPEPESEGEESPPADYQIMELVETAGGDGEGSAEATEQLSNLALAAGWSDEEIKEAPGWDAVAEMIANPRTEGEGGEEGAEEEEPAEEEESPADPTKGTVWLYQVLDAKGAAARHPKTKKMLPPVQVEVMATSEKARTATVKSSQDGKTLWKGVPFDQLLPFEE